MLQQSKWRILFLALLVSALWVAASAHEFDTYDLTFHKALVDRGNGLLGLGATIDNSTIRMTVSNSGIVWAAHASQLPPGHAVTLWVIVINNPNACTSEMCGESDYFNPDTETTLFHGGGEVIPANGKAFYFGSANVDTPAYLDFGPGLINLEDAQIVFDLRDHDLANEAILDEQLAYPNGGCSPSPPHAPCQDVQATFINLDR